MPWFEDRGDHLILNLRVIPRAAKDEVRGLMGDVLKVRIQAPPVAGKANAHLIKFLSKQWKVPRSNLDLLSGEAGRNKRLRVHAPSDETRNRLLSLKTG